MKKISKESIDSILIRAKEKLSLNDVLFSDVKDLTDNVSFLSKENDFLKETLTSLEKTLPPEQQWQNIVSSLIELTFLHKNKKDFIEINNSINNQTYTIIIQKKFGKTPQQLLESSEIRRLKLIKKNIALKKQIITLQDQCKSYRKEIVALKYIQNKFDSDESVQLSREFVSKVIDSATSLVQSFNNKFIVFEKLKLHKSFGEAFDEAWRRALEAENKVLKLKNENKKIKRLVLQKKYPLCRIYKGRLKRG